MPVIDVTSERLMLHVASGSTSQYNDAGTKYLVETPDGVLYLVYIAQTPNIYFKKSSDGGVTWSLPTTIFTGTATGLSIWYDRWSGISAGLIHCAYIESVTDETFYRTVDTESSDALSTQTTIFSGSSTLAGGMLSITRARGGNVYCRTTIDAGSEGSFRRLLNADVPNGAWAARTINEANATQDKIILVPGFAADDQDIMAIFWDASANEISRQTYDDSADSWAETSIATSMTEIAASTGFPDFAIAVDLANSQILLLARNAIIAGGQWLGWTVTESAITAFGSVPSSATTFTYLFAVGIDTSTGYWYVAWCATDNLRVSISTDDGATWGDEIILNDVAAPVGYWLVATMRFERQFVVASLARNSAGGIGTIVVSVARPMAPRAAFQLGA